MGLPHLIFHGLLNGHHGALQFWLLGGAFLQASLHYIVEQLCHP